MDPQDRSAADGEDPDDTLAESFWRVARRLRRGTQEALSPLDVSPSQARALGTLMREQPLRLRELADRLRIAPRSGTEIVDALESRDWVRRRPDPADRRATLVEVTDDGADVAAQIRAAQGSNAEQLFDRLSGADQTHLARILRTLLE